MSKWRKEKPQKFRGGADPLVAKRWLLHIEHVFDFLNPREEDKVRLVVRQFEDEALEWWRSVSLGKGAGSFS